MVFGVFPYPGVTVVDVDGGHVLVSKSRKDDKPFGEEVCLEAVAGAGVGQVHHQLVGFGIVRFESEEDVVYE